MARKDDREKTLRQEELDAEEAPDSWTKGIPLSPEWWAPTFITLLIVGLVWLVIYYFSGARYPIPGIWHWNLGIGITLMMAGFIMTLRWR